MFVNVIVKIIEGNIYSYHIITVFGFILSGLRLQCRRNNVL